MGGHGLQQSVAPVMVVELRLLAGTLRGCLGVSALSPAKLGAPCRARCSPDAAIACAVGSHHCRLAAAGQVQSTEPMARAELLLRGRGRPGLGTPGGLQLQADRSNACPPPTAQQLPLRRRLKRCR